MSGYYLIPYVIGLESFPARCKVMRKNKMCVRAVFQSLFKNAKRLEVALNKHDVYMLCVHDVLDLPLGCALVG